MLVKAFTSQCHKFKASLNKCNGEQVPIVFKNAVVKIVVVKVILSEVVDYLRLNVNV